jgi:hypothetical protein
MNINGKFWNMIQNLLFYKDFNIFCNNAKLFGILGLTEHLSAILMKYLKKLRFWKSFCFSNALVLKLELII